MTIPRDTLGNAMPRPVPGNCIDTTPSELWEILWEIDPYGNMPMPAKIRKNGKVLHFWKGTDMEEIAGKDLPIKFWNVYWKKFPEGHEMD